MYFCHPVEFWFEVVTFTTFVLWLEQINVHSVTGPVRDKISLTLMFRCQPASAWAPGILADVAGVLPNQNQQNIVSNRMCHSVVTSGWNQNHTHSVSGGSALGVERFSQWARQANSFLSNSCSHFLLWPEGDTCWQWGEPYSLASLSLPSPPFSRRSTLSGRRWRYKKIQHTEPRAQRI